MIACYRDAGTIPEFYRRLNEVLPTLTSHYEIIYVNDASPDNAREVLDTLAASDPRLVVIHHTRNFGSQNAFLSGMRVSRGDGVILMDGDLQDPPHLIPQLVARWRDGFDIVYGVRVQRRETLLRQWSYKAFYRLFRKMADISVPVDAGDFGLLDRKVVNSLLNDFPERLVLLRGLRAYTGFRHTGVDYIRDARWDGRSTNSLASNLGWAKLALFSFSFKPLEYISLLALGTVVVTLLAAAFYIAAYFSGGRSAPSGFMTLLLITLFLGSVQLVCFAILAEYLRHMYEELKRRPRYIVESIVDRRDVGEGAERR